VETAAVGSVDMTAAQADRGVRAVDTVIARTNAFVLNSSQIVRLGIVKYMNTSLLAKYLESKKKEEEDILLQ